MADLYVGDDGKLHKIQGGADTVLPFSGGLSIISYVSSQTDSYCYLKKEELSHISSIEVSTNDNANISVNIGYANSNETISYTTKETKTTPFTLTKSELDSYQIPNDSYLVFCVARGYFLHIELK